MKKKTHKKKKEKKTK